MSTDERPAAGADLPSPEAVPADADPPVRVEVYPGREAIVEFDPSLTFECVDGCTWCCHHGVLLYGPDLRELAERADLSTSTTQVRGERFTRRESKAHDHAAGDGAACHFLDGDGRCSLHAADDWKPARCSVFPLSVRRETPDDPLRVDVRDEATEHCDGLAVSERRLVANLAAFVPAVLWDLPDPDTRRAL